jgi:uncharacterized protein YcbK (DUF882 family)
MKKPQDKRHPNHETAGSSSPQLTRRTFGKLCAITAAATLLPRAVLASGKNLPFGERSLAFYNTHTSEKLKTIYWVEGNYLDDSLREINYILRDPRNNEVHDIDPKLLDFLFAIRMEIDANQPYHVISGYRSAHTNAFLRSRSSGVAENSLHLVGQAIDVRAPGRSLSNLRKAAMALKGGGVGYYPKSDFVHVDIGRVRYW